MCVMQVCCFTITCCVCRIATMHKNHGPKCLSAAAGCGGGAPLHDLVEGPRKHAGLEVDGKLGSLSSHGRQGARRDQRQLRLAVC